MPATGCPLPRLWHKRVRTWHAASLRSPDSRSTDHGSASTRIPNGDFLIDRHPRWQNVWLAGGGSGHGFKHGPAVGRYVAQLVSGEHLALEPRFSLATKGEEQHRAVH